MSATPADIAKYTQDGVLIIDQDTAVRDAHPDAIDGAFSEVESFYQNSADADVVNAERFAILSNIDPVHEGIEVDGSLGLGTEVPVAPNVPCFRAVDEKRDLDKTVRTRAYVYSLETETYSIEVLE